VHDPASHAWQGRRHRSYEGIYAADGTWYIYRSYGIHWCLNITSPTGDDGAAVLIRAVVPTDGIETIRRRRNGVRDADLTNGPGKLGQAFGITRDQNGLVATERSVLRLLGRADHAPPRIEVTPRIGISRAVEWPLRFLIRPRA